jgi:hypothetical protein
LHTFGRAKLPFASVQFPFVLIFRTNANWKTSFSAEIMVGATGLRRISNRPAGDCPPKNL